MQCCVIYLMWTWYSANIKKSVKLVITVNNGSVKNQFQVNNQYGSQGKCRRMLIICTCKAQGLQYAPHIVMCSAATDGCTATQQSHRANVAVISICQQASIHMCA